MTAVASKFKTDAGDFAEASKNNLEVFVPSHGIELADEEDVLRWCHVCIGKITHLQHTSGNKPKGQNEHSTLERRSTSLSLNAGKTQYEPFTQSFEF